MYGEVNPLMNINYYLEFIYIVTCEIDNISSLDV